MNESMTVINNIISCLYDPEKKLLNYNYGCFKFILINIIVNIILLITTQLGVLLLN